MKKDDLASYFLEGQVKKQKAGKRIFRDVELRKLFELNYNLFLPLMVKVDKFGSAYVVDYGDIKVKKFASDGRFIMEFGKGKGQGPGELLNPTDIAIDDSLSLWVCDAYNSNITIFDRGGGVKKILKLNVPALRISLLKDGKFIVLKFTDFEIYDINGRSLLKFTDELIQRRFNNPLFWNAFIENDGKFLYFILDQLGYIICVDLKDGKVKYRVKTIDDLAPPKLIFIDVNGAKVTKLKREGNLQFLILNINLVDSLIFNHVYASGKKDELTIVDAYSKSDGSYLYSFKIPEKFKYGYFDGRYYYGVRDTVVSKWEIVFR